MSLRFQDPPHLQPLLAHERDQLVGRIGADAALLGS